MIIRKISSFNDKSLLAASRTLTVPIGRSVVAALNIHLVDTDETNTQYLYVRNSDVNDEAPSDSAAPLATASTEGQFESVSGPHHVRTNTSSQVETRAAGTGDATLDIATLGWTDSRI